MEKKKQDKLDKRNEQWRKAGLPEIQPEEIKEEEVKEVDNDFIDDFEEVP